MRSRTSRLFAFAATLAAVIGFGPSAPADMILVTVSSSQAAGGLAITPLWIGLSNGSFNSFDIGGNANGGPFEALAELGDATPLTNAFLGFGPQTVIGNGPILPGSSASAIIDVPTPEGTRYLNYASMIVPSNDLFIGNANADQILLFNGSGQLIDASGNVAATRTIVITGNNVYDAGTEVNDVQNGGAFVTGVDALLGTSENGTIQRVFGGPVDNSAYLASLVGTATPAGYTVIQLLTASSPIATITFSAIPEPSSLTLAAVGFVAIAVARQRRRLVRRDRAS